MQLYLCDDIHDSNIEEVVSLHIKHLSYRSFITSFGPHLLLALYKDWIRLNNAILIISKEQGNVNGFVLGIMKKDHLFDPIKLNPLKYIKNMFWTVCLKPSLMVKMFETLFYKSKSKNSVEAELLVIVTDNNCRSKGLGTALINQLSHEFRKSGINEFIVTVHAEMERSNKFYKKNKMILSASFNLYGTKWNVYKKRIKNDENTLV